MAGYGDWEQLEYRALMSRGSDAERNAMVCWVASGLTAAVLLCALLFFRVFGLVSFQRSQCAQNLCGVLINFRSIYRCRWGGILGLFIVCCNGICLPGKGCIRL